MHTIILISASYIIMKNNRQIVPWNNIKVKRILFSYSFIKYYVILFINMKHYMYMFTFMIIFNLIDQIHIFLN